MHAPDSKSNRRQFKQSSPHFSLPNKLRNTCDDSEKLYCALAPRVHRFACKWTGCEQEAKDVVQNSFVSVYQGLDGFQGNSSLPTWVQTIARNDCFHRYDLRQKRDAKDLAHPDKVGPEGAAARNAETDRNRILAEKLLTMADTWTGTVLRMVFLDRQTQQETAERLGVSRQTIWKTIGNFRRKVRAVVQTPFDLLPLTYPGLAVLGLLLFASPSFTSVPDSGLESARRRLKIEYLQPGEPDLSATGARIPFPVQDSASHTQRGDTASQVELSIPAAE